MENPVRKSNITLYKKRFLILMLFLETRFHLEAQLSPEAKLNGGDA